MNIKRSSLVLFLTIIFLSAICFLLVSYSCDVSSLSDGYFCQASSWDNGGHYYSGASHDVQADNLTMKTTINAALSDYQRFDEFSLSPRPCSSATEPFLLLIIFSRPQAAQRRKVIRETFGSVQWQCSASRVRILFIVGQVADRSVQNLLNVESRREGDIIQSWAFEDGYGQSTRKGISLLHWSLLKCPQAHFTAKADDDCWINIPHYLQLLDRNKDSKTIMGLFWRNGARVIRDPKNKWSVSSADYPESSFPPYVSGILYALHKDTVALIAHAATKLKYLWHDDVFITGIAAKEAQVGHRALGGYDTIGGSWKTSCSKASLLAIHYVDNLKIKTMWDDRCATYNISC